MKLPIGLRAVLVAVLSALLFVGVAGTASAAPPSKGAAAAECAERGVPLSKISIQLYTFADYLSSGTDEQARHEEVLRRLAEMGYRNVEPYTLSGWTAEEYAALLDEYGLKASARHVDVGSPANPADIEQIIEDNRVLGIKYFGSGSTAGAPWIGELTTEADWIAYAEYLDAVGEQARKAGQTLMIHNHDFEFTTVFGDRTAFDILMQHTQKKNVVSQLDLYWVAYAGLDPVEVIEEYGKRVKLLHVKDLNPDLENRIEIVGRGSLDFPSIFAAAHRVRYYVVEHDPRFGDPSFDPFEAAQAGLDYLTSVTY
ncbi:sugar phosphate isomerase/epimerase [Modestobacter sp. VKM Ac-2979]|uniref:sugar phosphate isomerase/epimerase family protein n=1 Tax=unclassified Modestobacter TaxID=2643866 RepID=UPI0022AB6426|nr:MULTISPECIES: sugar phosphate isomerase/epimerase [unclassified Modestobacter]MCZ2810213.1 sugar phosphate isomerase/epimerase [Modestobacter sp. VKM Ac-2979]MCZ2841699.1 sugar phosphate isomerase/epimerase [Modestobacter sp. VKM Ac-2980]